MPSQALLDMLQSTSGLFEADIPNRPQGRYVHLVLVRESESFPIFQTDGSLNTVTVRAGMRSPGSDESPNITRLVMFKRKQSSPERLKGRELLKRYGYITDTIEAEHETTTCFYNPTSERERRCGACADCVLYGYAIGEAGAEKSKVFIDSAFSISAYDEAHRVFRFNALNENGTMYDPGESRPRPTFGEADHILPQVYLPAVVTLRDPTYEGFLYVLGNVLRCDRYGAVETHTGKMHNHLVAVCFANAEIFSNLRYTQVIYDLLRERSQLAEPLHRDNVLAAAGEAYTRLMTDEPVKCERQMTGQEAAALYAEVTALYQNDERVTEMLRVLHETVARYNTRNGRGGGAAGGRRRGGRRSRTSKAAADNQAEA